MTEIPLAEFMDGRTQEQVAHQIGVTQSRVSQMLRSGSDVYVVLDSSGVVLSAYEKRPVGQKSRDAA